VQWTAFFILSLPYIALIVLGLTVLAISGSCGPHNSRSAGTGLFCLTSRAIHGPLVNYSTN
jgi:hypothetical protein